MITLFAVTPDITFIYSYSKLSTCILNFLYVI